MTIEYEIIEEDYINFNLYHMQNSSSQKKLFNTLRFIVPMFIVPVAYLIGTRLFEQPGLYWGVVAIGIYIFWIYIYPKTYKKAIKKQLLKLLHEGDNSSFFGKKKIDIVDDQLILKEGDVTSTLPKDRVKEIREYDDMIVLYLSAVSAHIIPKRYLSDKDISDIRAILE